MNVCRFFKPRNIEYTKNHFVSCHLYDDEVMSNLSRYDEEYKLILAKQRQEEEAKKKTVKSDERKKEEK